MINIKLATVLMIKIHETYSHYHCVWIKNPKCAENVTLHSVGLKKINIAAQTVDSPNLITFDLY